MLKSKLQKNPKSKVIESGYINIYSKLTDQEKRQIRFKTLYKDKNPGWDESMVFLSNEFRKLAKGCDDLRVLDAGCGNGNYVIDENRGLISWAAGVDVSKEAVSKNVCLDEIKISNLENIPFENESFDVVISLWVLEHLEDTKKVFEEIHRVLKPGGVFLFATPNKSFLPLKLVGLIKYSKVNCLLNKYLFGRNPEDVFRSYYKANEIGSIRGLSKDLFRVEFLKLNYDPSYTSFGSVSFWVSNIIHKFISGLGLATTNPHIVGKLSKVG